MGEAPRLSRFSLRGFMYALPIDLQTMLELAMFLSGMVCGWASVKGLSDD